MPVSCCVVGCANQKLKGNRLSFFRFPKTNRHKRGAWRRAVGRGCEWELTGNDHICGEHFVGGWPSDFQEDEKYRPTLNLNVKVLSDTIRTEQSDRCQRLASRQQTIVSNIDCL